MINDTISDLTIENIPYNLVILHSLPDGNCYFHSILRSFCINYIKGNNEIRKNYCKKLRNYIAKYIQTKIKYHD